MRVLLVAPYIFVSDHKQASRNQSGLAYMVRDIADMISVNGIHVDVLTQSIFTGEKFVNGWRLVRKNVYDLIANIKMFYIKKAYLLIRSGNYNLNMNIRIILYFLSASYMEKVIEDTKPDVVHIHGIGLYTIPFLYASVRKNVKIVVTLHGLTSFNASTGTNLLEQKIEKEFLQLVAKKKLPITVISSGIKRKIENNVEQKCSNITTVLNSFRKTEFEHSRVLQNTTLKTALCVGSISERKNQMQALEALHELTDGNNNFEFELTIIGDGDQLSNLKEYAEKNNLDNVTFTGRISRDKVQEYYSKADVLILASIDEGFGLPVIEAYSYGVPVVAFSDLDAIPDLYDPKCMILVHERTTDALASGIKNALSINWDREYIKKHSANFSEDVIAQRYIEVLSNVENTSIYEVDIDKLIW